MKTRLTIQIFRRHQCVELGWEWYESRSLDATKEEARELAEDIIARSRQRALCFVDRSRYRYQVVEGNCDFPSVELAEIKWLNRNNKKYMEERAKWPTLVSDCSDDAVAALQSTQEAK